MTTATQWYSYTGVGGRNANQDFSFPMQGEDNSSGNLFIVCDGVGGNKGGDIASKIATNSLRDILSAEANTSEETITTAFNGVLNQLQKETEAKPALATMATTVTLLSFTNNGYIAAHCGDSRIYHIRGNTVVFKTKDHSWVNELIANGILTEEEAENSRESSKITRAMQVTNSKTAVPDIYVADDIQPGDVFLLCTDGVWECIKDSDLLTIINSNTLETAAEEIHTICTKLATDNHTFVLLSI